MKVISNYIICAFFLLTSINISARESFNFSVGDSVHVLSDKAFRNFKDDTFEAVGNVIITHKNNAIYGEKGTINFSTSEAKAIGNVRYIGPKMTLYGSEIAYDFSNHTFSVKNARVVSDNYVVLGREIVRLSEDVIFGLDAEYTTCQDCPESWSVSGRRIHITLGEYVRIWHAFIKVKGVVAFYIPYIILPIKKNRETGLLFPHLRFHFDEGAHFGQPWFWAINDHSDMTITPSFLGGRGLGNELQFRHMLGEKKWYHINSLQSQDKVYLPYKDKYEPSGTKVFRHLSGYEHHYTDGLHFNHHAYYNTVKDLDVVRDFDFYSEDKIFGSEVGSGAFFELRSSWLNINAESYFNRNLLYPDSEGFDDRYVQILPKITFATTPLQLLQTSRRGLAGLSMGLSGDVTRFKQNRIDEGDFIRNAIRYNASPYLQWNLGNLGPVNVSTRATLDYQHYRFPTVLKENFFSKRDVIYKSTAFLSLSRTFGSIEKKHIENSKKSTAKDKIKDKSYDNLVGSLPPIADDYIKKDNFVMSSSYRHLQEIRLNHYTLGGHKSVGNARWYRQIANSSGQFDEIDAIRKREHEINTISSRTSLPLSNTVELQVNNSLIQKSVKGVATSSGEFNYNKVAYFNLSQGYDLDVKSDKVRDKLTRIFLTTGVTHKDLNMSFSEYYFYNLKKHIMQLDATKKFNLGYMGINLNYDPFTSPRDKRIGLKGSIQISDVTTLSALYKYDIERKRGDHTYYKVLYTPRNNCWKLELTYDKTIIEDKISLGFLVNFNRTSFTSLSGF